MPDNSDVFDYVIVGAGTAGSILTNRLSADGARVCLLEAGPEDYHPFIYTCGLHKKYLFTQTHLELQVQADATYCQPQLNTSARKSDRRFKFHQWVEP